MSPSQKSHDQQPQHKSGFPQIFTGKSYLLPNVNLTSLLTPLPSQLQTFTSPTLSYCWNLLQDSGASSQSCHPINKRNLLRSPQRIILGVTVKSQGGLHPSVTQGTVNNVASGPPQYSWAQDLSTVTSSSPTRDSPVSTDNRPGHVSSLFPPPTLLTWTLPFLLISCLL